MKVIISFILFLACSVFALDENLIKAISQQNNAHISDELVRLISDTQKKGLPPEPLENKIWEGLSKGKNINQILHAVKKRNNNLEKIAINNGNRKNIDYNKELYLIEKTQTNKTFFFETRKSNNDMPPVKSNLFRKQRKIAKESANSHNFISNIKGNTQQKSLKSSVQTHQKDIEIDLESKQKNMEKRTDTKQKSMEKKTEEKQKRIQDRLKTRKNK
ncbi:MAG: hypothetical protein ABIA63_14025 [bacterium]